MIRDIDMHFIGNIDIIFNARVLKFIIRLLKIKNKVLKLNLKIIL